MPCRQQPGDRAPALQAAAAQPPGGAQLPRRSSQCGQAGLPTHKSTVYRIQFVKNLCCIFGFDPDPVDPDQECEIGPQKNALNGLEASPGA
jgi:hypothetical protein